MDTDTEPRPSRSPLRMLGPASVYVVIRLVSQAITLGATVLLARMLPMEAFAVIGTALLVQAFLVPISGLAIHKGLERLFFTYDEHERGAKIFTVFVIALALNLATSLIAYVLLVNLARLEFLASWEIAITLASAWLQSAQYVPVIVLRCEERLKHFALYQMAFGIVTQASVLAAVYFQRDVSSYFFGTLAGSVFGFGIWIAWLAARCRPAFVPVMKEFTYALPTVPVGILESIQQTVDRYILQLFVPSTQFASYSLAQRFAAPISTVAAGAKSALYPVLYSIGDEREIKALLNDATNLSAGFFGIVVNAIVVFLAFVLQYFLAGEFGMVFPVFIIIVIGLFLRVQEIFFGIGADIMMRLDKQAYLLVPVVFAQVVIILVLTMTFGIWGAACAYAVNGAVRSFAMGILGQRLLPRQIRLGQYALIMASSLAPLAAYIYLFLENGSLFSPDKFLSLLPLLVLAAVIWVEKSRAPRGAAE